MAEPTMRELLDVATEAAWRAGRRTLAYFGQAPTVETKDDGSPVTAADREAEAVMREVIGRAFPRHAILGEEGGAAEGTEPYRWLLDPIDGTRTFVRGVPLYGVLVAVEVRTEPCVGVIYLPALDEMVAAARGEGCCWNGRTCRVSSVARLDASLLALTSAQDARSRSGAYARLVREVAMERTWGDCYAYVLVATGRAEVALDPRMAAWDCAALLPIIEEAGGRFTDWRGRRTVRAGEALATNGLLHDQVVGLLAE